MTLLPSHSLQCSLVLQWGGKGRCWNAVGPGNVWSLPELCSMLWSPGLWPPQPRALGTPRTFPCHWEWLQCFTIILICRNCSFLFVFGRRALPKSFLQHFFDENVRNSWNSMWPGKGRSSLCSSNYPEWLLPCPQRFGFMTLQSKAWSFPDKCNLGSKVD